MATSNRDNHDVPSRKNRLSNIIDNLAWSFSYFLAMTTFIGVIFYIFLRIVKTGAQPIEMAIVTAILASIMLAGGFVQGVSNDMSFHLQRIGALYLVATIGFLVFGFHVTIDGALPNERDPFMYWYIVIVMGVTLYGGAIAFAIATGWLAFLLRRFFKKPLADKPQTQKKSSYTVVELIGKSLDIAEHIIKQKTIGGKPES